MLCLHAFMDRVMKRWKYSERKFLVSSLFSVVTHETQLLPHTQIHRYVLDSILVGKNVCSQLDSFLFVSSLLTPFSVRNKVWTLLGRLVRRRDHDWIRQHRKKSSSVKCYGVNTIILSSEAMATPRAVSAFLMSSWPQHHTWHGIRSSTLLAQKP